MDNNFLKNKTLEQNKNMESQRQMEPQYQEGLKVEVKEQFQNEKTLEKGALVNLEKEELAGEKYEAPVQEETSTGKAMEHQGGETLNKLSQTTKNTIKNGTVKEKEMPVQAQKEETKTEQVQTELEYKESKYEMTEKEVEDGKKALEEMKKLQALVGGVRDFISKNKEIKSNSTLFENMCSTFTAFDTVLQSKDFDINKESTFMPQLSKMRMAIGAYYDKNKGIKWSSKGRHRRDAAKKLLEGCDNFLINSPDYMKISFVMENEADMKNAAYQKKDKSIKKNHELANVKSLYKEMGKKSLKDNAKPDDDINVDNMVNDLSIRKYAFYQNITRIQEQCNSTLGRLLKEDKAFEEKYNKHVNDKDNEYDVRTFGQYFEQFKINHDGSCGNSEEDEKKYEYKVKAFFSGDAVGMKEDISNLILQMITKSPKLEDYSLDNMRDNMVDLARTHFRNVTISNFFMFIKDSELKTGATIGDKFLKNHPLGELLKGFLTNADTSHVKTFSPVLHIFKNINSVGKWKFSSQLEKERTEQEYGELYNNALENKEIGVDDGSDESALNQVFNKLKKNEIGWSNEVREDMVLLRELCEKNNISDLNIIIDRYIQEKNHKQQGQKLPNVNKILDDYFNEKLLKEIKGDEITIRNANFDDYIECRLSGKMNKEDREYYKKVNPDAVGAIIGGMNMYVDKKKTADHYLYNSAVGKYDETYKKIHNIDKIPKEVHNRNVTKVMYNVKFDNDGNVLPEYKEKDIWNKKWVNAMSSEDVTARKEVLLDLIERMATYKELDNIVEDFETGKLADNLEKLELIGGTFLCFESNILKDKLNKEIFDGMDEELRLAVKKIGNEIGTRPYYMAVVSKYLGYDDEVGEKMYSFEEGVSKMTSTVKNMSEAVRSEKCNLDELRNKLITLIKAEREKIKSS